MSKNGMFRRLLSVVACMMLALTSLSACANKDEKPTGERIPEGFKIRCYPKSECTKADSTPLADSKHSYVVVLKSPDDRTKIESFYKNEIVMNGYRLLNDTPVGEAIQMDAVNEEYNLHINILTVNYQSIISISWAPR